MNCKFSTNDFSINYVENTVGHSILWETHCHSKYEILAIMEGELNVTIEGQSFVLNDNDVIIIPPLLFHTTSVTKTGNYKRAVISFNQSKIPEELKPYFEANCLSASSFYSNQPIELQKICLSNRHEFYRALTDSIIIKMMYEYIDSESEKNADHSESDVIIQKILSFIDDHLHEKTELDDIAAYVSHSKYYICHLFQERMKISIKQYILQKKFALAEQIINDGISPTTVALELGYNNYSNFYRLYVKYRNKAPSKNASKKKI